MTTSAAARFPRPRVDETGLIEQYQFVHSESTKSAHRAPGPYWIRLNPDEKWTIARYDPTIASGEPGWLLIGLPCAVRERGDEEAQPVSEPASS